MSTSRSRLPPAASASRPDPGRRSVSVCLPARDEAATIGPIVRACVVLRTEGVVDEVVVADDSTDGTAEIARAAGATVHRQRDLRPEVGPVKGKGDAMWRALSVLRGDVVVFLDADTTDFTPSFVTRLVDAFDDPAVRFAKAAYRRPFRLGDAEAPTGGGRVTELTARPLLRRFFPDLADLRQPLAGEIAADRALLSGLAFRLGYGVDVGLLVDVWRACGRDAIREVDLGVRRQPHQSLEALHAMACEVADVILDEAAGLPPGAGAFRPPVGAQVVARAA